MMASRLIRARNSTTAKMKINALHIRQGRALSRYKTDAVMLEQCYDALGRSNLIHPTTPITPIATSHNNPYKWWMAFQDCDKAHHYGGTALQKTH